MTQVTWNRRHFLQTTMALAVSPLRIAAAESNIHWALGAVTWVVKAGKESPRWEDILTDIAAGGFEGFEPFTTETLPVNDENMALLEKLAPKSKLRMSAIYWGDDFHLAAKHDSLLKESHRFLGYLKRFGSDRLIIGPPDPKSPR